MKNRKTILDKIMSGYSKSVILLISIIGMIQYSIKNSILVYGFAGLFILGFIIQEFLGEELSK